MCDKAVNIEPWLLMYASNHLKTQGICKSVVEEHTGILQYVQYITQEMCNNAEQLIAAGMCYQSIYNTRNVSQGP